MINSLIILFISKLEKRADKSPPKSKISGTGSDRTKDMRKVFERNAAAEEKRVIERAFNELQQRAAPYRENAERVTKPKTQSERFKIFLRNIPNIVENAIYTTVGYPLGPFQNYQTKRHFKKDPESKEPIVFAMHGVEQTRSSQYKFGRGLKKAGYWPLHLKANHSIPREQNAERAFAQIKDFHKYTGLKNVSRRRDYFSGHSSGADTGIYMAGDKRIKEYGIGRVQARAPAPYGIKPKTAGQYLLMPLATQDDLKKPGPKKNAVKMAQRKTYVPVDVVIGADDSLVTPYNATYMNAEAHYVRYEGKARTTHFGTSGIKSDDTAIKLLDKKERDRYKREYYKR